MAPFDASRYEALLAIERANAGLRPSESTEGRGKPAREPGGTQTGWTNPAVDDSLGLSFAGIVFDPTKHPRGVGGQYVVGQGSSGVPVRQIQSKVGGVKVDGQYGPKTKAAIEAYQRSHGLQVDGVVGRQTAASLLGESKKQVGTLTPQQEYQLGIVNTPIKTTAKSTTKSKSTTAKKPPKGTPSPAEVAAIKKILS